MDGADLTRRLSQLLNEDSDSGWLDSRTTYDFLYEAALAFVDRTHCLKTTQSITTVADTASYNLNPDFLKLYLRDGSENLIIKYNNGNDSFLTWKDYEDIVYGNETTSVSVPSNFAVIDAALLPQVTGTATSTGTATGGLSTLTDTAGDFSNVDSGSTIHNTTDGSSGVVISKTSSTVIKTALFDGTNNDWSSSDAYIIQPQGRYQLILEAPPSTAGHTITVYYVQRPDPVYHSYGSYRFPVQYSTALIKYAFWLYNFRDKTPDRGNAMYQFWDMEVRRYGNSINQAIRPNNVKVSFKNGR
ncbi:MAG: hypothetical protein GWP06_12535 [Actinobacteria bacterium]|nr:hypothetical protein [Actinomycetota bacterium]